jgi:hypothetical protein
MSVSWGASLGVYQHLVGCVLGEISLAEASWSLITSTPDFAVSSSDASRSEPLMNLDAKGRIFPARRWNNSERRTLPF